MYVCMYMYIVLVYIHVHVCIYAVYMYSTCTCTCRWTCTCVHTVHDVCIVWVCVALSLQRRKWRRLTLSVRPTGRVREKEELREMQEEQPPGCSLKSQEEVMRSRKGKGRWLSSKSDEEARLSAPFMPKKCQKFSSHQTEWVKLYVSSLLDQQHYPTARVPPFLSLYHSHFLRLNCRRHIW